MDIKIVIESRQLSKEDLRELLQTLRECEQRVFPEKVISIWVEVPELTKEECLEVLGGLTPPLGKGPVLLQYKKSK